MPRTSGYILAPVMMKLNTIRPLSKEKPNIQMAIKHKACGFHIGMHHDDNNDNN